MALKDVAELVRQDLKKDEEFKGAFIANCMPTLFWYFIIGPLAAVMMKQYWITVTDKRLYFTRLNMLQKPMLTDGFEYGEISNTVIKGKLLTRTILFDLTGKKLKLTIPFRKNTTKSMLNPELLEFVEGKLK